MSIWSELRRPKFSEAEVAACKWLEDCRVVGWTVDLANKRVYATRPKQRWWRSLADYAELLGYKTEGTVAK